MTESTKIPHYSIQSHAPNGRAWSNTAILPPGTPEGNAHLIAAAPSMLAALRAVITGSTNVIGQDSTGQNMCKIREASIDAVRAAIAQAEGR